MGAARARMGAMGAVGVMRAVEAVGVMRAVEAVGAVGGTRRGGRD